MKCLLVDVGEVEGISDGAVFEGRGWVLVLAEGGCSVDFLRGAVIVVDDEAGNGMEHLQGHAEHFALILLNRVTEYEAMPFSLEEFRSQEKGYRDIRRLFQNLLKKRIMQMVFNVIRELVKQGYAWRPTGIT